MALADLPTELLLPILTYAAQVRGLKRALRLRCVCKRFAFLMHDAIYESTLLECPRTCELQALPPANVGPRALYRQRKQEATDQKAARDLLYRNRKFFEGFLAYRALKKGCRLTSYSPYLSAICNLARELLWHRHRRQLEDSFSDEEYREIVARLCALPLVGGHYREHFFGFHADLIDKNANCSLDALISEIPPKWLLSAAAYLGDIDIVNRYISSNFVDQDSLFPTPLLAASQAGHLEVVRALIGGPNLNHGSSGLRYIICNAAGPAGHDDIVGQALDPAWETNESVPTNAHYLTHLSIKALSTTTSISHFRLWFPQLQHAIPHYELKWLPDNVAIAARDGALEKLKFLIELGGPMDGRFPDTASEFNRPISQAAQNCHDEVVFFLLDNGAELDHALKAAVMGGSRSIVRLLMQSRPLDADIVQIAFVEAIKRENIAMIRCLEDNGAVMSGKAREEAVNATSGEVLKSMMDFLDLKEVEL
ncbi:hypothetical protein EJ05DRAFT_496048 [Pseudovirgaria hyperparasitica]|uniref:F-box domain-containing protein n=1 Tax=Pseudovirgaria hyperparasitica TaxID=470096 RepID=A0A6A6WMH3_9PEZI|nr:uncharacterized protein EJ05DRAFT_496048 [Pseudovirgaria hyperparasitica]KAF2763219.1 hypothetical protein EJ05DRAFT_496048 [Pseudovirgaria hyperparasitica]